MGGNRHQGRGRRRLTLRGAQRGTRRTRCARVVVVSAVMAGPIETELPEGSWASSAARRRVMQANRSRDTAPELEIRSRLHRRGIRFRVAARPLPDLRRTADIVHRLSKVAVFVDGCFWHGCPDHYTAPRTNGAYWIPKIETNVRRDRDTDAVLAAAGWLVIRIWEHDDPARAVTRVARAIARRRAAAAGPERCGAMSGTRATRAAT